MPSASAGTSNQTRRFISNLLRLFGKPDRRFQPPGSYFHYGRPGGADVGATGDRRQALGETGRRAGGQNGILTPDACRLSRADRGAAGAEIGGALADELGAAAAGEEAPVGSIRLVEAGALAGEALL